MLDYLSMNDGANDCDKYLLEYYFLNSPLNRPE